MLDSPRVQLHLLDGRTWLAAMPSLYDIIISEPSHPWQTGNANLFTEDFFQASLKRLRPEGVFCQWLPYYQMDKEHFQTLINTVQQSYPVCQCLGGLLRCHRHRLAAAAEIDWPAIAEAVERTGLCRNLETAGYQLDTGTSEFFYLDTAAVDQFVQNVTRVNSDDHPIIEYAAPKYLLQQQRGDAFYEMLELSMTARLPVAKCPCRNRQPGTGADVASAASISRLWGVPRRSIRKCCRA